jgi:hypothetical protein
MQKSIRSLDRGLTNQVHRKNREKLLLNVVDVVVMFYADFWVSWFDKLLVVGHTK